MIFGEQNKDQQQQQKEESQTQEQQSQQEPPHKFQRLASSHEVENRRTPNSVSFADESSMTMPIKWPVPGTKFSTARHRRLSLQPSPKHKSSLGNKPIEVTKAQQETPKDEIATIGPQDNTAQTPHKQDEAPTQDDQCTPPTKPTTQGTSPVSPLDDFSSPSSADFPNVEDVVVVPPVDASPVKSATPAKSETPVKFTEESAEPVSSPVELGTTTTEQLPSSPVEFASPILSVTSPTDSAEPQPVQLAFSDDSLAFPSNNPFSGPFPDKAIVISNNKRHKLKTLKAKKGLSQSRHRGLLSHKRSPFERVVSLAKHRANLQRPVDDEIQVHHRVSISSSISAATPRPTSSSRPSARTPMQIPVIVVQIATPPHQTTECMMPSTLDPTSLSPASIPPTHIRGKQTVVEPTQMEVEVDVQPDDESDTDTAPDSHMDMDPEPEFADDTHDNGDMHDDGAADGVDADVDDGVDADNSVDEGVDADVDVGVDDAVDDVVDAGTDVSASTVQADDVPVVLVDVNVDVESVPVLPQNSTHDETIQTDSRVCDVPTDDESIDEQPTYVVEPALFAPGSDQETLRDSPVSTLVPDDVSTEIVAAVEQVAIVEEVSVVEQAPVAVEVSIIEHVTVPEEALISAEVSIVEQIPSDDLVPVAESAPAVVEVPVVKQTPVAEQTPAAVETPLAEPAPVAKQVQFAPVDSPPPTPIPIAVDSTLTAFISTRTEVEETTFVHTAPARPTRGRKRALSPDSSEANAVPVSKPTRGRKRAASPPPEPTAQDDPIPAVAPESATATATLEPPAKRARGRSRAHSPAKDAIAAATSAMVVIEPFIFQLPVLAPAKQPNEAASIPVRALAPEPRDISTPASESTAVVVSAPAKRTRGRSVAVSFQTESVHEPTPEVHAPATPAPVSAPAPEPIVASAPTRRTRGRSMAIPVQKDETVHETQTQPTEPITTSPPEVSAPARRTRGRSMAPSLLTQEIVPTPASLPTRQTRGRSRVASPPKALLVDEPTPAPAPMPEVVVAPRQTRGRSRTRSPSKVIVVDEPVPAVVESAPARQTRGRKRAMSPEHETATAPPAKQARGRSRAASPIESTPAPAPAPVTTRQTRSRGREVSPLRAPESTAAPIRQTRSRTAVNSR